MGKIDKENIRIRDPFIYKEDDIYYLYGTTDENTWEGPGVGFLMYESRDLKKYEQPIQVFVPPEDFWATENFWAPEVCKYKDSYYLTASFKGKEGRGVQILKSKSMKGPFLPLANRPITPQEWDCLDGTLFFEENRIYMIFSHEWTQVVDGEICIMQIAEDMTTPIGEPEILFHASEASWTVEEKSFGRSGYVTDGPYIFEQRDKSLALIWSSFSKTGYSIGASYSKDGIYGPWVHGSIPLYEKDGGHGMIVKAQDKRLYLVIHAQNTLGSERVKLLEIQEMNGYLQILGEKE